MKIAIISGKDPTIVEDTDGANVLVNNMADSYVENGGATVDIFTPLGYSGHQALRKKLKEQMVAPSEIRPGVTIQRFETAALTIPPANGEIETFRQRLLRSASEADFFEDKRLEEYDIVHIIHMAHSFGIVLRGIVPLGRTVLHPMMLGLEYRRYKEVPDEYIDQERAVLKKKLLVQVPSEDEAKILTQEYGVAGRNIIHTPRGFNTDRFKVSARTAPSIEQEIKILCANMVRPQKGQHLFVPFAEECRRRGIKLKIRLIGVNGNSYSSNYNIYAQELAEEIASRGLDDYFELLGPMSQSRLNELMLNSHFAMYPSVFETFGKSPLESMATGLPTMVFDDVPAFREFIVDGDSGILVSRNIRNWVDRMEETLKDSSTYEKISQRGIRQGEEFTWQATLQRMRNDITQILNYALSA